MKQIFLCLIALFMTVPQANAMTGEEIIQKSTSLYREGINNEVEAVEITIVNGSKTKEKALVRYTQYDGEKTKTAIAFKQPPKDKDQTLDKGTKMSIWYEPNGKVDQWLILPSWGTYRQISGVDQKGNFVDHITREMVKYMVKEPVELFNYRILTQNIQQSVIEAVPKPGTESGFTKRLLYLDKGLAITKVEYYNSAGLDKVQTNGKFLINNRTGWWRTDLITIEDKQRGGSTTLNITIREINNPLPAEIFTKDFLTSKRY